MAEVGLFAPDKLPAWEDWDASTGNKRRQLPQRKVALAAGGFLIAALQKGQRNVVSGILLHPRPPRAALATRAAKSYPIILLHGLVHRKPLAVT